VNGQPDTCGDSAGALPARLPLMGYQLSTGPCVALAEMVAARIADRRAPVTRFACLNPHSYIEARADAGFAAALRDSDVLVADGTGVALAARLLGQRALERIPGPDFFLALSVACARRGGASCFFLGSTPQVLALIAERMAREFPGMRVAGTVSPPFIPGSVFPAPVEDELVAAVNAAKPDLLWLGLTAPKQELFMQRNVHRLHVRFIGSIGAAFDFFAGTKVRSHSFFRLLGLEWLPRFLREPRRLARRNFVSTPIFISLVIVARCRIWLGKNT